MWLVASMYDEEAIDVCKNNSSCSISSIAENHRLVVKFIYFQNRSLCNRLLKTEKQKGWRRGGGVVVQFLYFPQLIQRVAINCRRHMERSLKVKYYGLSVTLSWNYPCMFQIFVGIDYLFPFLCRINRFLIIHFFVGWYLIFLLLDDSASTSKHLLALKPITGICLYVHLLWNLSLRICFN